MTILNQSKFLARLLSALALISMFLVLPHNAKADAIAATGQCTNPNTRNGFGCDDPNYVALFRSQSVHLQKTDLSHTSPGFLAAPAGPSGAFWIAPLGDVQFGDYPANDWRVTFNNAPANTIITISGTVAAEGSVAVALDGFGRFLGPQSLTQLGNFSVTGMTTGTTNTLDFIFTGCSLPSCGANGEPVAGLLVDPSWSIAAPGTPLDTIPESVLFADKGFAPSSTPEPPALILLGSGLLSLAFFLRRR